MAEVSSGDAVCQAGEGGWVAHKDTGWEKWIVDKGFTVSMKYVLP